MAKGTIARPAYVSPLKSALRKNLKGAHVKAEQVRGDRYRFIVVWDGFNRMGHPERQRIVWDIADQTIKADLLDVAMILTLAPSDLRAR